MRGSAQRQQQRGKSGNAEKGVQSAEWLVRQRCGTGAQVRHGKPAVEPASNQQEAK
jgi:hypothetical protein